jgi:alkanesulfonate monooxygenase SsuD/methylene tetrahydromethanopterin reductase-like flavin-dependent oxidoreductase (luciferase family)
MSADGSRVSLGLLLAGTPAARGTASELLTDVVDLTRSARDAGYDQLVVGQHFLGAPNQYLQPVPLLTRLVAESGDMRLATGVLQLSLLQPVQTAEELATLDVISGGRLTVGFGAGYRDEEFRAFGMERKDRFARMLEALEVVRAVWSGKPVDHEGQFFSVHAEGGGIRPVQRPEPPLWSAAMTPVAVDRALRIGAVPYVGPRVSRTEFAVIVQQVRKATGDATATVPLRRDVIVARRRETAWAEAVAHVEERFGVYDRWGGRADLGTPDTPSAAGTHLRDSVIAGDRAECAELLREYTEIGAGPIVLRCQWASLPHSELRDMVTAAADALR